MESQVDVAIVGGGPTGLLLASELALAGLRVTVLERRLERVPESRALSMLARSVEILGIRGIADRFIDRGRPLPTSHFANLNTRLNFSVLESGFPFGLVIEQRVTEELLEERALEIGARLHRGARVMTVIETENGVRVSGFLNDNKFAIDAQYVVGADGARSIVRQQAGIAFPGTECISSYYFGDVRLAGAPQQGRFSIQSEVGGVEVFPIADGRSRVIFIDPSRYSVPVSTPVTLEEMQDGARRIIGGNTTVSDPSWLSRFGNESRLADSYRRGRIFLAGDAAHIHLPAGGQGMNTGLQDSMNLGWKLAGVLRGLAPEALLDSYHAERHPVGKQLIDNTLAQSAILSHFGHEGLALQKFMNQLLENPSINHYVAGIITALDIHYPDPLLGMKAVGRNEWVGRRLADAKLRLQNGTVTSLYGLLNRGNWIDLRFDKSPASPLPSGIDPNWIQAAEAKLLDRSSSLRGVTQILVRPDGHAAFAKERETVDFPSRPPPQNPDASTVASR